MFLISATHPQKKSNRLRHGLRLTQGAAAKQEPYIPDCIGKHNDSGNRYDYVPDNFGKIQYRRSIGYAQREVPPFVT